MTKQHKAMGDLEKEYEEAVARARDEKYVLHLYVTGNTPQSLRAVATIKEICEQLLNGR